MGFRFLMAPVNDKGGGGSGKKKDDDDDDDNSNDDALNEKITKMVNGAVNGLTKKGHFKELVANSIKETVGPMFDELKESFGSKRKDKNDDDTDDTADKSKNGNGKGKDGVSPEMQARFDAQDREIKRLKEEGIKSKEEATAAKKRNDEQEERGKLRDALKAAGVPDERLPGALALLYLEQKKIARDKDGKIKFVIQKDDYEDQVELDKGVGEWIKSPEGKSYLPPKNVEGAGTRGGPPPVRRGEEPSEAQLMHQLGSAMMGHKIDIG